MRLLLAATWRAIKPSKRYAVLFVPTTTLLAVFWVIEPLYGRYAVDQLLMIAEGAAVSVPHILGIWIGIYIAVSLTQGFSKYFRWNTLNHVLTEARHFYYERVLALDISHHVRARGGELMKTIDNASEALVDLNGQIFMELLPATLTSLAFMVLGFFVSPILMLITVTIIPLYILITIGYIRWTRKNVEKVNRLWVTSIGRGYDVLTNIFTVKSSGAEGAELERMRSLHREGLRELRKVNLLWAILEGVGYFMLLRILLIATGILLYARGELSLGSVFFFQFGFFRMIVPLEMLGNMMPHWNEKLAKLRLAEELYRSDITIRNRPSARVLPQIVGRMEFKNVSFAYPSTGSGQALETIHDLTLRAEPGEHIAFVGQSGAGKSTLAMLLNRFYDPLSGAISIDGVDLRDLDVHWWRTRIGLVLQENITFNDTILANVRYSRPEATEDDVIEAAKRACAHDFIVRFPQGYATLVGERGVRLSGGERQRIAIARAILKKPSLIVLDEATSALDSITEREVQRGIRELITGKTAFIIAHRLSTVRAVDRIAFLERGQLLACAPHEELLRIAPTYKQMVELQHEGLLAE